MADIFMSYARMDRATADSLAGSFQARGWTVWWDRQIRVGRRFRKVIEREIDSAGCVIVLWSQHSVDSDWVIAEANEGLRRNVLIPIRIEDVRVPFEFRAVHTADLFGDRYAEQFEECVSAIASFVPPNSTRADEVEEPPLEESRDSPPPPVEPRRGVLARVPHRTRIWLVVLVLAAVLSALTIMIKPVLLIPRPLPRGGSELRPLPVAGTRNFSNGLPIPRHVVIVIEENKGYGDVIGSKDAPYINALAARGALLEKFYAAYHPSQPNYIDLFAGDTLGVCKDECPIGPFNVPNLGAALIHAGRSFAGFAEDLPASGARTTCRDPRFAPKHCPWVDFSNVPASASRDLKSFPRTVADFDSLPLVSFVIPNLNNDMHNGNNIGAEVRAGDAWLRARLGAYANWAEAHNSLLIITWDEDSSRSYTPNCARGVIATHPPGNHIPTIIMGQPVAVGTKSDTIYDHHDLLRTILEMYDIVPFAGATSGRAINDIWLRT